MRIGGLTSVGATPYAKRTVAMKRENNGEPVLASSKQFLGGQGQGQPHPQPMPRQARKEIIA